MAGRTKKPTAGGGNAFAIYGCTRPKGTSPDTFGYGCCCSSRPKLATTSESHRFGSRALPLFCPAGSSAIDGRPKMGSAPHINPVQAIGALVDAEENCRIPGCSPDALARIGQVDWCACARPFVSRIVFCCLCRQ